MNRIEFTYFQFFVYLRCRPYSLVASYKKKKKNKYKKTTNKQNKDKEQFGPEGKQKTKRIGLIQLT